MITDIRSYIKEQIALADSSLKENDSAFYREDIGEGLIDRSYQIEINNITNTVRDSHFQKNMDVVVSIFGHGYRDEINNYDDLIDKAICIGDNITEIKRFTSVSNIVNVELGNIAAIDLPTDQNSFKIDINFALEIAYIREE